MKFFDKNSLIETKLINFLINLKSKNNKMFAMNKFKSKLNKVKSHSQVNNNKELFVIRSSNCCSVSDSSLSYKILLQGFGCLLWVYNQQNVMSRTLWTEHYEQCTMSLIFWLGLALARLWLGIGMGTGSSRHDFITTKLKSKKEKRTERRMNIMRNQWENKLKIKK